MNDLTLIKNDGEYYADSREVAAQIEQEHSKLLRSIRTYSEYLTEAKIGLSDFFVPAAYKDSTGKTNPCYLITKKGCGMIANKLTGKKGVLFTAAYVTAFEKMQQALSAPKTLPNSNLTEMETKARYERATAMRMNAENRRLKLLLSNPNWKGLSDVALQTMGIKAVETVTGQNLGNMHPKCDKTYSATEVCKIFKDAVTPQRLGSVAKNNHVKTEKYGVWCMDKSPYCSKEVQTFRYNESGIHKLAELIGIGEYCIE